MPNIDAKQSKIDLDSVLSRFSNRTETINSFYKNSPTFREICADYTEMFTWLENNCQSETQPSVNCAYAQETLKELEAEIVECLDGKNKLVTGECIRLGEK